MICCDSFNLNMSSLQRCSCWITRIFKIRSSAGVTTLQNYREKSLLSGSQTGRSEDPTGRLQGEVKAQQGDFRENRQITFILFMNKFFCYFSNHFFMTIAKEVHFVSPCLAMLVVWKEILFYLHVVLCKLSKNIMT